MIGAGVVIEYIPRDKDIKISRLDIINPELFALYNQGGYPK